ncbi:hypothetical protein HMPREF1587_01606 [Bifidobacterium breve JCP7499]|nr:hypothetical protein HMPREF1587_01606 [Bifidobacterium breve JCP7499]
MGLMFFASDCVTSLSVTPSAVRHNPNVHIWCVIYDTCVRADDSRFLQLAVHP